MLAYLKVRKENIGVDCGTKAEFDKRILADLVKKRSIPDKKGEEFIRLFMLKFVSILKNWYKANDNIIEAIDYYHNKGVKLVCLSDYSMVKERLVALDIDIDKFTLIKSSEDYGTLKPAESAFLKISESLNITPSKILVIGDREDTDGDGARRSKMQFIKYPEDFKILS
jgi:FMN phosphatase YigB (HAD superfamily)